MDDVREVPEQDPIKASGDVGSPSLTLQLLYAVLAQLEKANHQLIPDASLLLESDVAERYSGVFVGNAPNLPRP